MVDLELATVFWPSAPLLGSDPCCFPSDLFNPEESRVAGIPDWGQAQAWGGEHSPIREDRTTRLGGPRWSLCPYCPIHRPLPMLTPD